MRIDYLGAEAVKITLSEKNLLTLLHKLEVNKTNPGESACGITKEEDGPKLLMVYAEPDDVHYDRPDGPAGIMHPREETALIRGWRP
jgi:hypothetical protein